MPRIDPFGRLRNDPPPEPNVWIVRVATDPPTSYVYRTEARAMEHMTRGGENPEGWGHRTLYVGHVQEVPVEVPPAQDVEGQKVRQYQPSPGAVPPPKKPW